MMRFIDSLDIVWDAKGRTKQYFTPRAFAARRMHLPLV